MTGFVMRSLEYVQLPDLAQSLVSIPLYYLGWGHQFGHPKLIVKVSQACACAGLTKSWTDNMAPHLVERRRSCAAHMNVDFKPPAKPLPWVVHVRKGE